MMNFDDGKSHHAFLMEFSIEFALWTAIIGSQRTKNDYQLLSLQLATFTKLMEIIFSTTKLSVVRHWKCNFETAFLMVLMAFCTLSDRLILFISITNIFVAFYFFCLWQTSIKSATIQDCVEGFTPAFRTKKESKACFCSKNARFFQLF